LISTPSRYRLAALVALLASSLLHVAAMAVSPDLAEDVLVAAGSDTPEAALGNNFADLIKAGDTLDPVEATEAAGCQPVSCSTATCGTHRHSACRAATRAGSTGCFSGQERTCSNPREAGAGQ
jgi:hypothetical protein